MTYYFDASVQQPVAIALTMVRGDILWAGGPTAPARNADDVDWLPVVGEQQWVVIARDKKIRSRPAEREAVKEHNVGMFSLTAAGNYSKWGVLRLLVTRWGAIEAAAATTPRPYIYSVTKAGVRRIEI